MQHVEMTDDDVTVSLRRSEAIATPRLGSRTSPYRHRVVGMAVGMEAIFARPPTSAGVCESADVDAGDGPADHQLLDLLGALEEVVDLELVFADVRIYALSRTDIP